MRGVWGGGGGWGVGWRGALASTSRSAKASSPMTALFYSQPVAGQCLSTGLLYIPLEPWRAHINVLNTHACTSVDIRSKQKHGGGNKVQTIHRTIAPNIRTIHRNSTWLQRKSNYAVPIRHTTLFLFSTNHKFKILLIFPRDPAKKSCSQNMNLVQAIIPYHANILQMLMWNHWKTLKIPWNFSY